MTLWRDFGADLAARTERRVIAYDRAGTAYLGRMAVFVKDDLPALQAQLPPQR